MLEDVYILNMYHKVKDFLSKLRKRNVIVSLQGNDLKVNFNQAQLSQDVIAELKDKKSEIVEYLKELEHYNTIPLAAESESYPLSSSQRRLWALSQNTEASVAYNMPFTKRISKDYNIDILKQAIHAVVQKHEILRTVYREDQTGEIRQWILPKHEVSESIECLDFTGKKSEDDINAFVSAQSKIPFDLENGPLFKVCLLQLEDHDYILFLNLHHTICDGWSMNILAKDIFQCYQVFEQNQQSDIKQLEIQYKDYAVWQNKNLSGRIALEDKKYWSDKLSGSLPIVDLPGQKKRPKFKTFSGKVLTTTLPVTQADHLQNFCEDHNGSIFMALVAIWKVLLYRYTHQKDIILGTAVAGRDNIQLENQIGLYVNTLALRSTIDETDSFISFFNKVKQTVLTSFSHYSYPFDAIIEELDLNIDPSRNPIFDIIFSYEHKEDKGARENVEQQTSKIIKGSGTSIAKFDLGIHFTETKGNIVLNLNYNTDLYETNTIEQLIFHFRQLTQNLLSNPEEEIGKVCFLTDTEKKTLIEEKNNTTSSYPNHSSIVELFQSQVSATPNNDALQFDDKVYTYKELDEISNKLAAYLSQQFAFDKEDFIGIKLGKSEWIMISILSILKNGAAYVPIDPAYPQERINYIEKDSNCKIIIDEKTIESFIETKDSYSSSFITKAVEPNNLAYVMYTSGSTGNPKGVMVEHKSIVRLVKDTNFYQFSEESTLLSTGAFSFDATTLEYWGPLLNGAKLIICRREELLDADALQGLITKLGVKVMWFTAGWLHQLVDDKIELFTGLDTVIAGGDRLSPVHISRLRQEYPDLTIINGYGPTENTTFSLTHNIQEVGDDIPIGLPINNSTVYILDDKLQLVPEGVVGEICLGGDGLSRGYLNRTQLTAEKFVKHPFNNNNNNRIYRTGDLGRWSSEGYVEFIGRKDNQVKIRGNRIELGEIENQIKQISGIQDAVVLVKEVSSAKELAAYFVADNTVTASEIRADLKRKLPEFMVPSYFMKLEELPLTTNGKVDKKSLPVPQAKDQLTNTKTILPTNAFEEKMVSIWKEVLNCDEISLDDDFFDLGGHSLKATKLISEYHKAFHIKLSIKEIYQYSKLSEQVTLIDATTRTEFKNIDVAPKAESYPLSDAQQRLWVSSQFEGGSEAYNMPFTVVLKEAYEVAAFKKAIDSVIERHEILRTVFKLNDAGEIRQWVLSSQEIDVKINCFDYQDKSMSDIDAFVKEDEVKPFDLENGPLLRVNLFQLEPQCFVFYYNIHHIIGDGQSMDVLAQDVMTFYKAYQQQTIPDLPPLKIQYKDFAYWERSQNEEVLSQYEQYWGTKLANAPVQLDFPGQNPRPNLRSYQGKIVDAYLSPEVCEKLVTFCNDHNGSVFMGIVTIWNILFYKYTSQTDLLFGTPVSGREHIDLEHQIGCYLNTLVLRNRLDPKQSFEEVFNQVKHSMLDDYKHQSYSFDKVVETLNIPKFRNRNPLFDVMLSFHNKSNDQNTTEVKDFEKIRELGETKAKLDMLINFVEVDDYFYINVSYNSDLYSFSLIKNMLANFKVLVAKIMSNPTLPINQIDYQKEVVKAIKNKNLQRLKNISVT